MPPAIARLGARLRDGSAAISTGQKIVIGLLLTGLVFGGVVFTRWISQPSYSPLFSNLSMTDAAAITEALDAEGVKYETENGGTTVLVDRDLVNAQRLAMSGKGLPADTDAGGYTLLDEQGITTNEFQQQVAYQRAVEGELAKTLGALAGVKSAVVHLAIPKEEVFVDDEGVAKASVLLDLAPGTELGSEQVQAVTHLVSSSVDGMAPEDVTVADSTGRVLSADGVGGAGGTSEQVGATNEYEAELQAKAQEILDRVAGPGGAVVQVRAQLDFSQSTVASEEYPNNDTPPSTSQQVEDETYTGAGGALVGGVLGPDNQADANTGTGGTDGSYSKKNTTSNNALNKTVTNTVQAPGAVQRLTVSVALDQATAGALPQATVQALVSNAIGFDAQRGDAITVAALPFDTSAADSAAADLAATQAAEAAAAKMQMIKYAIMGALALLVLVVALVVWLRRRRDREEPEEDEGLTPAQMLEIATMREELANRQVLAIEATGPSNDELERRQQVRDEIAEMVSDSPDEVAAMLRGWLAEEKV